MNATLALCEFASGLRWDALPRDVRRRAGWCLADWVACAVAGAEWPTSRAVSQAWSHWAGRGPCSVVGQGHRYPPEAAVFLNAFASEVLEIGHGHGDGAGHLGGPTIPVALALGEMMRPEPLEILAAIVAGYEVFACVGGSVSPSLQHEGFISTGLAGTMGAAVVAARMTALSAREMAGSLGVAAYLAPASLVSEYYGTVNSAEAAQAAGVGLLASRLASAGLAGSDDPVTAFSERFGTLERLRTYLDRLGREHQIMNLYFKPHPGCRYTHGSMEAIAAILAETSFRPQEVEKIRVRVTPSSLHLCGKYTSPESSFVQAQFSLPYVIAAMVFDGTIGVESFAPESLGRNEVHRFAKERITLESAWSDRGDVDFAASEIELVTVSGARWDKAVLHPKGSPGNPMNDRDLRDKFLMLTRTKLGDAGAQALLDRLQAVDTTATTGLLDLLGTISGWRYADPR